MGYRITTIYRPEDLTGLYNAHLQSKNKKLLPRLLRILAAICSFILFVTSIMLLFDAIDCYRDFSSIDALLDELVVSLFALAISVILFLVSRRKPKGKRFWKAYPYKGSEIVYQFLPDQFRVSMFLSETTYSYSAITRFLEDSDRFYLFLVPKNAAILPKRDIQYDLAEFCRYIEEATGLSVEQIKKK